MTALAREAVERIAREAGGLPIVGGGSRPLAVCGHCGKVLSVEHEQSEAFRCTVAAGICGAKTMAFYRILHHEKERLAPPGGP